MNIFDLAAAPDGTLGPYERQQKYLLQIWAHQVRCPWCETPQRVFDVYGLNVHEATFDDVSKAIKAPGRCISCTRLIQHAVPLFAYPHLYLWIRAWQ